ncbi:MAG: hypothetical protein JNJ40_19360 [Bacteroidia bacterium]|nr:hypothetical protein [Bacteroidia bacterium]
MPDANSFTIEHVFQRPLAIVYDLILDFKKFWHFHPYMKVVKVVSEISPDKIEYEVYESLLMYGLFL